MSGKKSYINECICSRHKNPRDYQGALRAEQYAITKQIEIVVKKRDVAIGPGPGEDIHTRGRTMHRTIMVVRMRVIGEERERRKMQKKERGKPTTFNHHPDKL